MQLHSPAALCTPLQTIPGLPNTTLHLSVSSGEGVMYYPHAVLHMQNYMVSKEESQFAKVPKPQE